jgi:hypothetical protein
MGVDDGRRGCFGVASRLADLAEEQLVAVGRGGVVVLRRDIGRDGGLPQTRLPGSQKRLAVSRRRRLVAAWGCWPMPPSWARGRS